MVSTNSFVKYYSSTGPFLNLPANNYWILREESILSYLEQRGAKVPKVFIKNTQDQSLTIEFVGKSFHDLFIRSTEYNSVFLMECIKAATTEFLKIFDLGVLHLDIAARNITYDIDVNHHVYILDFAQSLSSNNVLQKPIPLIPQPDFQHPELVDALKEDWAIFFQHTQNFIPDLNKKFEVDDKIFTQYWNENLAIQKLHSSLAILSHSLGQLYFELSESPILNTKDNGLLINLGHSLRYRENSEARLAIEQALFDLSAYIDTLKSIQPDNVTQVPIVQRPSKTSKISESDHVSSLKKVESKFKKEIIQSEISLNSVVAKQSGKNALVFLKPSQINEKLHIVFALASFLLLCAHTYWLDLIVSTLNIFLPDLLLYGIFLIGILAFFSSAYGFFKRKTFHTIFLNLSILLLGTQVLISCFILFNSYNSLIIWLPSGFVYFITALLIYKSRN
jgi:hypothetical protein